MSPPQVEFLWWRDCPSWERALQMLRGAMTDSGLNPDIVEVREINTEDAAEREEFPGSPTIRIDGSDFQPPAEGEPTGLVCRVYRRRDGRISPLPDPEDLREALQQAAE